MKMYACVLGDVSERERKREGKLNEINGMKQGD